MNFTTGFKKIAWVLSLVLVAAGTARADFEPAEPAPAARLRFNSVEVCNFWNSFTDSRNRQFYACSLFPRRMDVVDSFSLDSEMTALQQRIDQLEARLRKLEGQGR